MERFHEPHKNKEEMSIKEQLYQACENKLQERISTIQNRLAAIQESRSNETKSSVGDKHETGRAMMQLEEEKANYQLAQVLESKHALANVNPSLTSNTARKGSLILTNKAKYYIVIGVGKVIIGESVYFCISTDAPIAKALMGKMQGEEVVFNGRKMVLEEIY